MKTFIQKYKDLEKEIIDSVNSSLKKIGKTITSDDVQFFDEYLPRKSGIEGIKPNGEIVFEDEEQNTSETTFSLMVESAEIDITDAALLADELKEMLSE